MYDHFYHETAQGSDGFSKDADVAYRAYERTVAAKAPKHSIYVAPDEPPPLQGDDKADADDEDGAAKQSGVCTNATQPNMVQPKATQGNPRQPKATQGTAQQGRAGQGKARQGKARHGVLVRRVHGWVRLSNAVAYASPIGISRQHVVWGQGFGSVEIRYVCVCARYAGGRVAEEHESVRCVATPFICA